jgi:hypothetical protein
MSKAKSTIWNSYLAYIVAVVLPWYYVIICHFLVDILTLLRVVSHFLFLVGYVYVVTSCVVMVALYRKRGEAVLIS